MRRLVGWLLLIGLGMAVSGCATAAQPTVYAYPKKGQTAEQVSRDQSECQAWAKQQTGFDPAADTAKGAGIGALIGAAAGAATGAAVGAVTGSPGRGAAIGAATGGIGGAAIGGGLGYTKNKEGFNNAYSACMSARGYEVK
jgi:phage tail tape-measure protein